MSILWTSADAVAATSGRSDRDWQASGVSIDSRSLAPGDLFVALKDVRDGHDFVAQALEKGAAAALVSRVPDGVGADAPLLIVEDVLQALQAMARFARARTAAKVVGITGSVGKTSSKEMLRTALAGQGRVFAAEKSYNNHWGVPLTLARMPQEADFAVTEIGMSSPGEIAPLAELTRPDVAMITTVVPAHMQAFDGIEGIAVEKASIFKGLQPKGVAVVNGDLDTSSILIAAAQRAGATLTTFGTHSRNAARLQQVELRHNATIGHADLNGTAVTFTLASPGQHFAMNALGVLAVVQALGADIGQAAEDLRLWQPPAGRGTHENVQLDASDPAQSVTLIDDAYNANPTSLDAALKVLAASRPTHGASGRRVAILGDMLELGADEMALHAAFAAHPSLEEIDQIHCCGLRMRSLWEALPPVKRGHWRQDAADLAVMARELLDAGDVVLVKGSLGSEVSRVVRAIRQLGVGANTEIKG